MSDVRSGPERRRVMRLDLLRPRQSGDLAPHAVHLLDLSPLGVRIAHREPWPAGVVCAVELPPALGALRLPGRVVWTRLRAGDDILEGDQRSRYESGVETGSDVTIYYDPMLAKVIALKLWSGELSGFVTLNCITSDGPSPTSARWTSTSLVTIGS